MGYTPDNQKLHDPITDVQSALKSLKEVIQNRIDYDDNMWMNTHIIELNDLRNDINNIEIKLRALKSSTP